MVNCSVRIVFNPQRVRQDGTVLLYMRVIIDRKKKDLDLKVYWELSRFDLKKRRCIPRFKEDQKCTDYNLLLGDAEAKANEIFIHYRLKRLDLSLEIFLVEFSSTLNKSDFLKYMEEKINLRYRQGEIEESSRDNHMSTFRKLSLWKSTLSFADFNNRTAQNFDSWMHRKTGAKTLNARWACHKNFKTYLNLARKVDHLEFIHPYDFFKAKNEVGRYQPLTKDQFLQFLDIYQDPLLHPIHRVTLRAFLFCCVTGMRHGDLRKFSLDWIDGDFFDFVPHKTKRYGTRVRMPITKEALDLIADEIDEIGDTRLFQYPSEQKQNTYINEISDLLEIKASICFQIGRETFATLYMEHDGKLEVLASFLGHTTTQMSEKYVKIMDQRKKSESLRISRFMVRD